MLRKIDNVMMGFVEYPNSGIAHIGLDEKGNKWLDLSRTLEHHVWYPVRKIIDGGFTIQFYVGREVQYISVYEDSDRLWYPAIVNNRSTYLMRLKERRFVVTDNNDGGYVFSADKMEDAWSGAQWWLKFWNDGRSVDIMDNVNNLTCTLHINK